MFLGLPGRAARALWKAVPYPARRRLLPHLLAGMSEADKLAASLPTMEGLLQHARANGLRPRGIVDVGAYAGDWTRVAAATFPDVPIVMFEANPERADALERAARDLGSRAHVAIGLLGATAREAVPFYTSGTGSSVFRELTAFEKATVSLPMTTLDEALDAKRNAAPLAAPLLLKLDVQGAELEVLKGGASTLARAELVILETATIPYNDGAPLIADVISFMNERGFVIYDFCGQYRRETDHTLFQTDVAFVRADSGLRAPKKFWSADR